MATHYKLLVKGAKQVVQVRTDGKEKLCGKDMQRLDILEGSEESGISILVDRKGNVVFCGSDDSLNQQFPNINVDKTINAAGKTVIPGFVDAHTHPVWAGERVHEFAMKLAGAGYMEIHKAGGGIHYTVDHTRNASEEELYRDLEQRLGSMSRMGTTLIECKSGYGLDKATEVKMLKVIDRARRELKVGISSTYCGAHAVPKNTSPEDATDDIILNQIPEIKRLMDQGMHVDNVDVFCEKGVYDLDQSRRILEEGRRIGLQMNFHADEIHPMNGAKMGADIGALAISHLEEISDEGIAAMATSGSVGVVLPTTAYILRLTPPPVRKMIEAGMAVALGSDFNPNAYCMSMPMVMHLACVLMKMTMSEALVAATLNAAAALGRAHSHGSISVGKSADLVIINASRWEHIIYQFGCHDSLIQSVIVAGNVIHERA